MKAFLLSIVVLLVVSLGAGFVLDGYFSTSATDAYTAPSTRL